MKEAIAKRSSAARASLQRIRFSFTRKADDEIFSEDARKIIDPRSISLRAIKELRDEVLSGEAAAGVELYVAKRDLSDEVKKGATIQVLRDEANGKLQGRVSYVDVPITFQPGVDADPKPRQDWSTEDVAEHVVLALTKNQPHAQLYLDHVEEEDVGKEFQGTFVSQARKCRFQDLVAALEDYFGQDADAAFVWLDLFCANQPLLTSTDEDLPPEVVSTRNQYLTYGLHRAIGRFESAIIFFDRWDAPAPLRRAWCVWEIMGAITQGQNFEVAITPGQEQAFVEALLGNIDRVVRITAANNNMRRAMCWKREDKNMIDYAVETTVDGGYVTLIKELNRRVHAWWLKVARDAVLEARSGDGGALKLADILAGTGELLNNQGEYSEALKMHKEALSIYKKRLGNGHIKTIMTRDRVKYLRSNTSKFWDSWCESRGEVEISYRKQSDDVWRSLHIRPHRRISYVRCPELADRLSIAASKYVERGHYNSALKLLDEALGILKENFGDRHPKVALTLNKVGTVYDIQGYYSMARLYYEEALSVFLEAFGDQHPLVPRIRENIHTNGAYIQWLREQARLPNYRRCAVRRPSKPRTGRTGTYSKPPIKPHKRTVGSPMKLRNGIKEALASPPEERDDPRRPIRRKNNPRRNGIKEALASPLEERDDPRRPIRRKHTRLMLSRHHGI